VAKSQLYLIKGQNMAKESFNAKETIHYETEQSFVFYHHTGSENYPAHWHDAVEIIMPTQNTYRVDIDYRSYELREYDILVINSGGLHEMFAPPDKGQRILLQFDIVALNVIRGFTIATSVYAQPRLITPENHPGAHEKVKNLLLEIMEERRTQNDFYDIAIMNKIISITLELARMQKYDTDMQGILVKRKLHMYRLNECLNYINHHFTENLTLETVAQTTGFSKFHFSRWFREYTNTSFHDYLTKVRIDKAKSLLLNTTLSILEIALESGFQSSATFNRVFKSQSNLTPKEYRNTHMQKLCFPACQTKSTVPISRTFFDDMFSNPFIWSDIPDPDVIRVGDTYYMVSTTMYFSPGIPVMKSYNLVNWEIVNYVYDILDDSDVSALRNGANSYGKGSWAASLRYHNNTFYVLVASFSTNHTYMYQTEDIENRTFRRYVLSDTKVYHDPSLLFDDDGRVYVVYDGGTLKLIELTQDATAILPGGCDKIIIENADVGGSGGLPAEGSHFYKLNGMYYLFLIAWPNPGKDRRIELCYRASHIEGPYEGQVVLDDDMGYNMMGVAQGGIVDTPEGNWYAMLFQDHGAVGRIPVLVPVTWEDDWPVFGIDGKVPHHMKLPSLGKVNDNLIVSDEFNPGTTLPLAWQWNHNPVNSLWSLEERAGYLRLKSGEICNGLLEARNTLTQRTLGPVCAGTIAVDVTNMRDGDFTGLAALQEWYGYVGIKMVGGIKYIIMVNASSGQAVEVEIINTERNRIYLGVDFDFDGPDTARFYYNYDELNWNPIGDTLKMQYRLSHFTGYRFALFYYSTANIGGFVDFDYFRFLGKLLSS